MPTYITENGLAWQEDTVAEAVNDTMRQQYLHDHIDAVGQALQAGCDIRGYFVWSFQVSNFTRSAMILFIYYFCACYLFALLDSFQKQYSTSHYYYFCSGQP